MDLLLYSLVVFFATVLGATSGAGGGAIIKPVFDLIGRDTVTVIGIYSTLAVFAMCLAAIYKHSRSGSSFDKERLVTLSLGSLLGGILGEAIFRSATQAMPNATVTLIQSLLLFLVLLAVLIFTRKSDHLPKVQLTQRSLIFLAGSLVGSLSVFLGIGGGPLNVIVLVSFMSLSTKDAAAYSIAMIFFAQIPKVIKILLAAQAPGFRWQVVPFLMLAALLGGNIGTRINQACSDKQVKLIYSCMMAGLLVICAYNILRNWP